MGYTGVKIKGVEWSLPPPYNTSNGCVGAGKKIGDNPKMGFLNALTRNNRIIGTLAPSAAHQEGATPQLTSGSHHFVLPEQSVFITA